MKKAVEAVKAATQRQRKAPGSAELLNCLSAVEGQIQVVAAEERPALLEGMPLKHLLSVCLLLVSFWTEQSPECYRSSYTMLQFCTLLTLNAAQRQQRCSKSQVQMRRCA